MPEPVSAPVGQPESAPTNAGTQPSQGSPGDEYRGKSREQVIADLEARNTEYDKLKDDFNVVRDFTSRVQVFFKREGEDITLNEDAVKMYAQSKGWLENPAPGPNPTEGQPAQGEYEMGEASDEKKIQDLVDQRLNARLQQELKPYQEDRAKNLVDNMAKEFPDFMDKKTKVLDWAQRNNYPLTDLNRLKSAYYASKGEEGKLMDVGEHQANIDQLQTAMDHSMSPSARRPMASNPDASNEELLGMVRPAGTVVDEKKQAAMQELLGTTFPPPPP